MKGEDATSGGRYGSPWLMLFRIIVRAGRVIICKSLLSAFSF